jgi:hypothetical protein
MNQEHSLATHNRPDAVTLVIPILPGQAEPWRRFRQEMEGSRRQAFVAWCQRLGLTVQQIWLNDTPGGAVVVLKLEVTDQEAALAQVADASRPFDRWLRNQVLALHGLDLSKIAQATRRSLLMGGGMPMSRRR